MSLVLSGKPLFAIQSFGRWIVELSDNAVRGNTVEALRHLIKDSKYEEWIYETSASPKAAEMTMANISTLYGWITAMLEGSDSEPPMTLVEVVNRLILRDMMEKNEEEDDSDAVQLMTFSCLKRSGVSLCLYGGYGRRVIAAPKQYRRR